MTEDCRDVHPRQAAPPDNVQPILHGDGGHGHTVAHVLTEVMHDHAR